MHAHITSSPKFATLPDLFRQFDANREARKIHFFTWYERTHPLSPSDDPQEMAWLFDEKRKWAQITDEELHAYHAERQKRDLEEMDF